LDRDVNRRDERAKRAMATLLPFVAKCKLSLNPEDLEEIVHAVLVHADSDESLEEIDLAVRRQLAEYKLKDKRLQLEAYRGLAPEQADVVAIIDLLVEQDFETIEFATRSSRQVRPDLKSAISEYGRALVAPDKTWWSTVTVTAVEEDAGGGLHVAAPTWTAEEGRPDLTLELRLIGESAHHYEIEVQDLDVPAPGLA
jgi:hypothetical protein